MPSINTFFIKIPLCPVASVFGVIILKKNDVHLGTYLASRIEV